MSSVSLSDSCRTRCWRWRGIAGLGRDDRGTTAIEFGLVGLPFLMLCFGVINIGLHFLTTYWLEHSVFTASRLIRTGQAQSTDMSVQQFKDLICGNAAAQYVVKDCNAKSQLHVQSWEDGEAMTPQACLNNGALAGGASGSAKIGDSSGGASRTVLVTFCYEWELAAVLPFLRLGKMSNGSALIQAASAFRTEPYE